jgi:hypothetical protein
VVAVAAGYPHRALQVALLATVLGFLALYAGFAGRPTMISPLGRRSLELVEYFALAVVVPLTLWLCGLFGAVRSVNVS